MARRLIIRKVEKDFPFKKIKGVFGFGKAQGELFFTGETLRLKDLKDNLAGKIIAALKIETKGVIFKAASLEAAGLLIGKIDEEISLSLTNMGDFREIKDEIGFAFLALDFGKEKGLALFKKITNKKIILNGENKILEILE